MTEQDEASDEIESSFAEMEETSSRSWSVLEQQQKPLNVMEEFNQLEIDVSLQRKEAMTSQRELGRWTGARCHWCLNNTSLLNDNGRTAVKSEQCHAVR